MSSDQKLNSLLPDKYPLRARYKNRDPDPGLCIVLAIDWEKRKVNVTNGAVRLYPEFEEITLWWKDEENNN